MKELVVIFAISFFSFFFFRLRSSWVKSKNLRESFLYVMLLEHAKVCRIFSRPDWIKMVSVKMFQPTMMAFLVKQHQTGEDEEEEYWLALCSMHMFFSFSYIKV